MFHFYLRQSRWSWKDPSRPISHFFLVHFGVPKVGPLTRFVLVPNSRALHISTFSREVVLSCNCRRDRPDEEALSAWGEKVQTRCRNRNSTGGEKNVILLQQFLFLLLPLLQRHISLSRFLSPHSPLAIWKTLENWTGWTAGLFGNQVRHRFSHFKQ